jgi:hypothetical protein
VSLSPVCGILMTESIEAAETTVSTLQPEAVAPLGTEDETLGLTARQAPLGARFPPARWTCPQGRLSRPAGRTHEVDVTSPSLCVATAPAL